MLRFRAALITVVITGRASIAICYWFNMTIPVTLRSVTDRPVLGRICRLLVTILKGIEMAKGCRKPCTYINSMVLTLKITDAQS